MAQKNSRTQSFAAAILCSLGLAAATPALGEDVNMFDGQWHASLTPYLWLAGINGSTSFSHPVGDAHNINTSIDAENLLKEVQFSAMLSGEIRKGDWSIFSDYMYLDFKDKSSQVKTITDPLGNISDPIDMGSTTNVRSNTLTLGVAYTPWHSGNSYLDVFAGTRYLSQQTTLDWSVLNTLGHLPARRGSISAKQVEWDAIVGVKGQLALGEGKWFMPYYFDVGSGPHNTTWQALIGAGYRYDWGEMALTVRSLSYNIKDSGVDSDIRTTGPALSARFAF